MPDEIKKIRREDLQELSSIKTEHQFQAVNLSLDKNEMFKTDERYSTGKVEQEAALIQRVLGLSTTGEISLTTQDKADLAMKLDRRMSFLLLNDEKTTGDSKEMALVKKHLETLENILSAVEDMSDFVLTQIGYGYDNAIKACENYIKNKNPWFQTGKRRLAKVKETHAKLIREKECLSRGQKLYELGLIDETKIKNPLDLIKAENMKNLEKQNEAQKSEKFLAELVRIGDNDGYFELQKSKNSAVKDDNKPIFYAMRLLYDIDTKEISSNHTTNKDWFEKKYPSYMKEIGLAGKLQVKATKGGLDVAQGEAARLYGGMIQVVKRDENGEPLDETEAKKEEQNLAFEKLAGELIDARIAVKNNPDNEQYKERLNEKQDSLCKMFMERFEAFDKKFSWPSFTDLKNDPQIVDKLVLNDYDSFSFMFHAIGIWDEIRKLWGNEKTREYLKDKPILDLKLNILANMGCAFRDILEKKYHFFFKDGISLPYSRDPYLRFLAVKEKKNVSTSEVEEAQNEYREEVEGQWIEYKNYYDQFANERTFELLKRLQVIPKGCAEEKYISWMLANNIPQEAERIAKERNEQGIPTTALQVERMLALRQANGYFTGDEVLGYKQKLIEAGYDAKKINGQMSRAFGAILFVPKYNKNGEPLDEEEAKKVEWNKKWFDAWINRDQEQKKELMREGINRAINVKIPTPDEIKANGLLYYIDKDPFFYGQLMVNTTAMDNLRGLEPDLFNEIMQENPLLDKRHDMLVKFASYVHDILEKGDSPIITNKLTDETDLLSPEEYRQRMSDKDSLEVDKEIILTDGHDYEEFFNQYTAIESEQKWKQENLSDTKLQKELEKAREINPDITEETVVMSLEFQECTEQLNEFNEIEARARELKIFPEGTVSRILAAGFYFVKRTKTGIPVNDEEKRKADHNEKWKAAWKRFIDAKDPASGLSPVDSALEIKKARLQLMTCYESFCRYIAKTRFPKPDDIKDDIKVFGKFVSADPFAFRTLENYTAGYDGFKKLFSRNDETPPEIERINSKIKGIEQIHSMADLVTSGLSVYALYKQVGLDAYERKPAAPTSEDEMELYKENYDENFTSYETNYKDMQKKMDNGN